MKRKSLIIMLLMALFVPLAMNGQGTLTIGTGTNTSGSGSGTSSATNYGAGSPMGNTYYYYSTAQFIYLASEMEGAKTINSLAFYHGNAGSFKGTINIYLMHTSSSTVSTSNPATSGTLVYTGTNITIGSDSNGWQTFSLDTPFEYNGTDNLMVVVCRTKASSGSPTYHSSQGWRYTTYSGDYRFMQRSADTNGYDNISNTSYSYTSSYYRPNIQIGYELTTPYVTLDPSSATVMTGFTQTLTATTGNVTGTPTITYSSSNTSVATVTGSGTTATVTGVAPGTATITATMTYESNTYTATCAITVEDPSYCEPSFSSPSDDYISNFATTGGTTNINNSSSYVTGGYSDYYNDYSASIDAGGTLSCTVTPSSTQWSYGHAIWVDWNKDYEFSSDERVAYTTSTATGNWTGSVVVPADANGGDYRLRVIHLYNNTPTDACMSGSYGEAEDYKLTVLAASNCPTPAITNIAATSNSATITTDSEANSFNVRYREYVENTPTTYDFEDGWQGWTAVQGTDGTSPHNWMHNTEYTAYSSNGNVIDLTTSGYNSSAGFMLSESYISAPTSGGTATGAVYPDNYLISPQIRLGGSMTFYAAGRTTDYAEKFTVMVSTTGTNISDFVATSFTVTLSSQTYTQYTVDLSAYSGMGYVIFHHYDCTDQHMLRIDDVTIVAPSMQWQTGNDLTITGLEPATTYEVQVQANCGDDDGLSGWSTVASFTTLEIPAVPVESITVTPDEIYPTVGVTYSIVFTVLPADATNPAVTFSSSDEDVATVNENGTVTAVAAGTATITIAATDGSGVTGTLTVNVMNIDVEEITADDITMGTGETATISYIVAPANATDLSVTFTSANTAIATVDGNGVVTGVGVGKTTITIASVQNPEVTTDITVTVTPNPNAAQFTLNVDKTLAAPGDVITVEAYLNEPEEGEYNGFTGLVLGLHFDPTAFEVNGNPVAGPVTSASTMAMPALPNATHPDLVQYSLVMPVGTPNTTTGLVFTAQFTVLTEVELGSYTFYAEPTAANNFVYNPDSSGQTLATPIPYEYVPSTVEIAHTYTLDITPYHPNSDQPDGWNLIASPVTSVTPSTDNGFLTNTYDLYYFDQTGGDNQMEWRNYKQNNFNLVSGRGYLYANSGDGNNDKVTLTFFGTPYTGDGEFDLTYASEVAHATMQGWNLVGNPYTTKATVNKDYYVMNPDGTGLVLDALSANGEIDPMQGIFVLATEAGQKVKFTPVSDNNSGTTGKSAVELNLSQNRGGVIDRAIVRFDNSNTLPKFQLFENSTKLYIEQDNKDYAVVNAEAQGEMPVSFKASKNGSYTISINTNEVEMNYLHLIDNLTGADVDLMATPSYTFNARTDDYASRFRLVFSTGNANDSQFAFISNGEIVLNGQGTVQMFDVTGRMIGSYYNATRIATENMAAGVYMLQLINGESVKTQKIIVK